MSTQGALEHEGEFPHSIRRAQKGIKKGGSWFKLFLKILS